MGAPRCAGHRIGRRGGYAAVVVALAVAWQPATTSAQDAPPCTDVAAYGSFSFADRALAVSPTGHLYTTSGSTVIGRDPGTTTVVFTGTAPDDAGRLIDLAVAANGEIVALGALGQLVRFAPDGSLIGTIDVGDINANESSVAVHPDGRIWVADPFMNTLRAFMPDGSLDVTVESSERPGDIEITPAGEVVTVDGFEQTIRWFAADGSRLGSVPIGHVHAGDVELAVDNAGRVHLSDPFTDTVQVFDPSRAHLFTIAASEFAPTLVRPLAIEPLPNGGVIVGDSFTGTSHTVQILSEPGPVATTLEADAMPDTIEIGRPVRVSARVTAVAPCSAGPFEVSVLVPDGLAVTGGAPINGLYWPINLLDTDTPDAEFSLEAIGRSAGTFDVAFELSGPGVMAQAVTRVVVNASTTTTSTVPASTTSTTSTSVSSTTNPAAASSTTAGAMTDALPATGSGSSAGAVIALFSLVLGTVLVRSSRRPGDGPAPR